MYGVYPGYQMPQMPQRHEIIKVNGESGVNAFQMLPNSEVCADGRKRIQNRNALYHQGIRQRAACGYELHHKGARRHQRALAEAGRRKPCRIRFLSR